MDVVAVIQAEDAAAAASIQTAAAAVNPADMATAVNDALVAAGVNVTVVVESLSAELGPAPTSNAGGDGSGDDDAAPKAVVAPILGGLIAQLIFFSF